MSLPTIVGRRKLECLCYVTVKTAWSYCHSYGYNNSVWQTDGRTDRIAVQAMPPRCKNITIIFCSLYSPDGSSWQTGLMAFISHHFRHRFSSFAIVEHCVTFLKLQTFSFLPREAAMLARSWDRNSVCLSHACFVTKRKNVLPMLWYRMKGW